MKIGIICAVENELHPFLEMLTLHKKSKTAMVMFYEGELCGAEVVMAFLGVCKVNAAITTQTMINKYQCSAVINAGTAGGMHRDLDLLDTVVSTEAVYHDVESGILTEYHPWLPSPAFQADPHLLQAAKNAAKETEGNGHRIFFGRMVTGEQFIEDDRRDEINHKFSPLSVDMETAAMVHVCYVHQIPFLSIRTITDTAEHKGQAEFAKNCEQAAQISADFTSHMLQKLCEEMREKP